MLSFVLSQMKSTNLAVTGIQKACGFVPSESFKSCSDDRKGTPKSLDEGGGNLW